MSQVGLGFLTEMIQHSYANNYIAYSSNGSLQQAYGLLQFIYVVILTEIVGRIVPFRHLVSLYNCHVTYTPMMLAKEFSRSPFARSADFSTSVRERGVFSVKSRWKSGSANENEDEEALMVNGGCNGAKIDDENHKKNGNKFERIRGTLVAQFASCEPQSFADAVELIHPYVDGVDLNCGMFLNRTYLRFVN